MRWSRFSRFDFNDPGNVYFHSRRHSVPYWILLVGGTFAFLLCFISVALSARWDSDYLHGKGAWLMALMLLLPLPVRATLFVFLLALVAECFYRAIRRAYDHRSAFIIGPTGVAWLDPWRRRAFGWDEVREITRDKHCDQWGRSRTLVLSFISDPAPQPRGMPDWLWDLLPPQSVRRAIAVPPSELDRSEEDLIALIRCFAGPVTITERDLGV